METDNSEDEDYQLLGIIENTRYISACERLAKSQHFTEEVLNGYDDERFKTYYRMNREDFHFALGLIKTNPVFYNNSACEQASHDSTAYKDLPLHLDPDVYFGPTQYLLADSAYSNTMSIVTPFKQYQGYTARKAGFNCEVSHIRVTVEHTIGVLKARFGSLQCLPMTVSEGTYEGLFQ
ncbi:hypothetical protein G7K_0999-t1 [Saitoella complicata NRRL Y-17804]|uniref:DDE Tnp4 domain-containing protein n=1 Tax=Saitoella complicata (strain BCRC 22490 / CBS 7301 / JCM 7358 / NBRC 10748 / NRRL Y-17804) TaxID=698492 RepID=A0A0E9NAE5_SAICN|nr:hypothetical protein G7K_0999-t1 [Saitoella complicata NRRL Y-17804]